MLTRSGPDPTRSLSRAIGLLRLLAGQGRRGWRISDLARRAGLDLATTHRLLAGLLAGGLATRVPDSRNYALGPLAWQLGLAAAPWYDLDPAMHERLRATARSQKGTIFLKVRSGPDSVCVARHDGTVVDRSLLLDVGGRRPLMQTAGGVSILITLPAAEQRTIESDNLARLRAQGRDPRDRIRRMLVRSHAWGFGVNLGDMVPGIQAISRAFAVVSPAGSTPRTVGSLSLAIAGPTLGADRIRAVAARLAADAAAVADAMAGRRY